MATQTETPTPGSRLSSALYERETELAALNLLISQARAGRGGSIVIEGPAGRGKTALLDAAGARVGTNMHLARACATLLEQEFAFGTALQLLEPFWMAAKPLAHPDLLGGTAELAQPLFSADAIAPAARPERRQYRLIRGLHAMASNVARTATTDGRRGLAILIDEVNLADERSLRFLAYLTARIGDVPLCVVSTMSRGAPCADEAALAQIVANASRCLHPDALSKSGLTELLEDAGIPSSRDVRDALKAETEGNARLASEAIRLLRRDPTAQIDSKRLNTEQLQEWARGRFTALGKDAFEVARAAALLEPCSSVGVVADLIGHEPEAVARAADRLTAAEVLCPGEPLRFVHPVVAAAARTMFSSLERSNTHARAAELLMSAGGPATAIVDHLLRATPRRNRNAMLMLKQAARGALQDGAYSRAAELLTRALAEQPHGEDRVEVLADLAAVEHAVGVPSAVDRLAEARRLTRHLDRRAELALLEGRWHYMAGRNRLAALAIESELNEVETDHDHIVRELLAVYVSAAALVDELRSKALERREQMLEALVAPSDAQRAAIAHIAMHDSVSGAPRGTVRDLAELAWGDGALLGNPGVDGISWPLLTASLLIADDVERAVEIATVVECRAKREGSRLAEAAAACMRSWAHLQRGELGCAFDAAAAAVRAPIDQSRSFIRTSLAVIASCHIEAGRYVEADAALEQFDAEFLPAAVRQSLLLEVRGRLRLAEHRPAEALETATLAAKSLGAWHDQVGAAQGWRATQALALLALGDRDGARRIAEENEALARASGITNALIRDLRVMGLVVGGSSGLEFLNEAIQIGDAYHPRMETIRALVDLGAALRRSNRRAQARHPLRRALDLAERGGASVLAARARTELLATGAKPRRAMLSGISSLTASQHRVAELAAREMTTRQIAEALFVSPKTVEFHLREIYRKLGIASRGDLVVAMSAQS